MSNFADVDRMAADAFQAHRVDRDAPCRTHRFKNPDGQPYWFRVTWVPGQLFLSGDLGNLTVTHYHALPTFEEAVVWARGAGFEYLMEKTGTDRTYAADATVQDFRDFADQDEEHAGGHLWSRIMDATGVTVEPPTEDHDEVTQLKRARTKAMLEVTYAVQEVHQAADFARRVDLDDYYGAHKYGAGDRWKYLAIRHWANNVLAGDGE